MDLNRFGEESFKDVLRSLELSTLKMQVQKFATLPRLEGKKSSRLIGFVELATTTARLTKEKTPEIV
jgi:hypothetical protein